MAGENNQIKKQYRGCSRLYYALRTVAADGTITRGTPKLVAKCKTVNANSEQSKEKVFADNHAQYSNKSGIAAVRTFDTFPIPFPVLAELFDDTVLEVADTIAYGENPDAEDVEVSIGYALHDGDPDKPCELVWVDRAVAQKRPDTVANTITETDTASEGQQIAFDIFTPEKAWTSTGKKNPSICVPVTDSIDVDTWFAQVVTWDNVNELFPKANAS